MANFTDHKRIGTATLRRTMLKSTDTPTSIDLVELASYPEDGGSTPTFTVYEIVVNLTPTIHSTSGSVRVVLRSNLYDIDDANEAYDYAVGGLQARVSYQGSTN